MVLRIDGIKNEKERINTVAQNRHIPYDRRKKEKTSKQKKKERKKEGNDNYRRAKLFIHSFQ